MAAQPNTTDASARGEVSSRAAGSAWSKSAVAASTSSRAGAVAMVSPSACIARP